MIGNLRFGDTPAGAEPIGSWPTYSRVGALELLDTGSGVKRLRPYRVWPQDKVVKQKLADDQDMMEIIIMAVEAGLLD